MIRVLVPGIVLERQLDRLAALLGRAGHHVLGALRPRPRLVRLHDPLQGLDFHASFSFRLRSLTSVACLLFAVDTGASQTIPS